MMFETFIPIEFDEYWASQQSSSDPINETTALRRLYNDPRPLKIGFTPGRTYSIGAVYKTSDKLLDLRDAMFSKRDSRMFHYNTNPDPEKWPFRGGRYRDDGEPMPEKVYEITNTGIMNGHFDWNGWIVKNQSCVTMNGGRVRNVHINHNRTINTGVDGRGWDLRSEPYTPTTGDNWFLTVRSDEDIEDFHFQHNKGEADNFVLISGGFKAALRNAWITDNVMTGARSDFGPPAHKTGGGSYENVHIERNTIYDGCTGNWGLDGGWDRTGLRGLDVNGLFIRDNVFEYEHDLELDYSTGELMYDDAPRRSVRGVGVRLGGWGDQRNIFITGNSVRNEDSQHDIVGIHVIQEWENGMPIPDKVENLVVEGNQVPRIVFRGMPETNVVGNNRLLTLNQTQSVTFEAVPVPSLE